MRRRAFVAVLGGAAAAWTLSARAQQAMPVIGFLGSASAEHWAKRLHAFREGLAETGYVEGRNVAIEYRWAEARLDRLPGLAQELVRERIAVLVVIGGRASTEAAKAATTTNPVVFRLADDPVAAGLVANLSRPGGNLTGITTMGIALGPKQLQLLRDLTPAASRYALLVNPTNPLVRDPQAQDIEAAARTLGMKLDILNASTDEELDAAFARMARSQTGGLMVGADVFFNTRHERMAVLSVRHAIPTISPYREFPETGGLMSYGGGIIEASRQAGVYTGRILKGEKPGDLPVQQIAKIELVINLKTARALGIAVPESILARADEVIE